MDRRTVQAGHTILKTPRQRKRSCCLRWVDVWWGNIMKPIARLQLRAGTSMDILRPKKHGMWACS